MFFIKLIISGVAKAFDVAFCGSYRDLRKSRGPHNRRSALPRSPVPRAEAADKLILHECGSLKETHWLFSSAVQLITTLSAVLLSPPGVLITTRFPSGETSYGGVAALSVVLKIRCGFPTSK